MFEKMEIFQTAMALARHSGMQQATVARNIANADTPGFRSQEIAPFMEVYDPGSVGSMRATRAGHVGFDPSDIAPRPSDRQVEPSPNGNTVSIEQEMVASIDAQRQHSRALAIYKHSLDLMRLSLGRR